jgi:hypothetical protein
MSNAEKTVKVKRVPLDSQGYDRGGRYFGVDAPLFHYEVEQAFFNDDSGYMRAANYQEARAFFKRKGYKVLR